MSLKEYHRKRNFRRTKEPFGDSNKKGSSDLIFVIQKHAASHLHYDFRLEMAGVLKSWAVPKGPSLDPSVKRLAMHVEDHPIEYANFEGIIPKGEYGGGTVMIWDSGTWEPLDENPQLAYQKGDLNFLLHGKKLHGRWKLLKIKRTEEKGKEQWLLFKLKDDYAISESNYDIKKDKPFSSETQRSMQQIAEEKERMWTRAGEVRSTATKKKSSRRTVIKMSSVIGAVKADIPAVVSPELATLVVEAPKGEQWLHEIKWDGYRLIGKIYQNEITLLTRRNNDWTHQFPALVRAIKSLRLKDSILDGEVVALDKNNKTNFQILQNSMEDNSLQTDLVYYIFDLLYYDGYSMLNVPLIERKKLLKIILDSKVLPPELKYNDHIIGNGNQVFDNACKYQLEGIVSKRITSHYSERRTKDWLKVKCNRRQEFIIAGYTDPKSSRQHFGALLLGYYDKQNKLIYCGRVGTGFTQQSLKAISAILKKYGQKQNPFTHFPERVTKDIHWIKPTLVAEIEFLEMTDEGVLRHPSFKGLREDKKANTVSLELPQKNSSTEGAPRANRETSNNFTNLQKVLYPDQGFTKGDLVNYYESIADWILPHIKNRPLTLVRCPTGHRKNCFYQKHLNETVTTEIKGVDILEHGRYEPYIYINNFKGLMGLVQMGVLEIHPWGSSIKNVELPDRMIFDLDPAPEITWEQLKEGVLLVHEFLNQLKLKNFLKTTGGKGLHVVVPITPHHDWELIRALTQSIAELIVEYNPKKYIATMSKAKRKGKIFIDYLRNARGATAIAAYSTRARTNATVAVPLAWEELNSEIRPDSFNIINLNARLTSIKTDPWADFFKTKQRITDKIIKLLLK